MKLPSRSKCELRCYQEADCVSYNFGPTQSDAPSCDLNNSTHLQVSSSDFVTKDGYIYRYILVRNKTKQNNNNNKRKFCFILRVKSIMYWLRFLMATLWDASLTHTCFPALQACCMYLVETLIKTLRRRQKKKKKKKKKR